MRPSGATNLCGLGHLEGCAPTRRAHNHPSASRVGDTGVDLPLANFRERRKAEVQLPRILLPRTPVNKGKKKGRDFTPRPFTTRATRCPSLGGLLLIYRLDD